MRKILGAVALSVVIGLTGCNGGLSTPSDKRPTEPKKIAKKTIDPAHYKTETKCIKYKGFECVRYRTTKKLTDDKDWLLTTSDGTTYDVTESEYNSVSVGQWWYNSDK